MLYFRVWQQQAGGQTPVQMLTSFPATDNQWARALIIGGRGLYVETAQSALTVILKLGIGGLTSLILIVLSPVSLSFQGHFILTFLKPVLRIMAAYVTASWPFG